MIITERTETIKTEPQYRNKDGTMNTCEIEKWIVDKLRSDVQHIEVTRSFISKGARHYFTGRAVFGSTV